MFKLDNQFLMDLGLGTLPVPEKNKLLAHIYETLELRVGMRLAEQMSDDQLDQFESFIERNDEAGALKWLESNFPDYKQVVSEELDKLKGEIKGVAPQILASAQQPIGMAPAATGGFGYPMQQPAYPQAIQTAFGAPALGAAPMASNPAMPQMSTNMPLQPGYTQAPTSFNPPVQQSNPQPSPYPPLMPPSPSQPSGPPPMPTTPPQVPFSPPVPNPLPPPPPASDAPQAGSVVQPAQEPAVPAVPPAPVAGPWPPVPAGTTANPTPVSDPLSAPPANSGFSGN